MMKSGPVQKSVTAVEEVSEVY